MRLPADFVTAIESVGDGDIDAVAQQWSKMDELADWEISELADVVRRIRGLVHAANSNNQIVVQLFEL